MEAAYRKHQTNLLFSGLAIMAFGLWSAVKLIVYLTLHPEVITNIVAVEALEYSESKIKVFFFVFFGFFVFVSLMLHFFIGSSAVRDARRKTRLRIPYITVSVIYAFLLITNGVHIFPTLAAEEGGGHLFTTIVIDATSLLALAIIVVSSHKLNKIRKKQVTTAGD